MRTSQLICTLITAIASALFSPPITAQNYYVHSQATGTGSGASWQDAFTSIRAALAVATANDEIWVSSRTGATPQGGPLVIPNGVTLIGGFWVGATNKTAMRTITILISTTPTRIFELGAGSVLEGFGVHGGQSATGGGGILVRGPGAEIRSCQATMNRNAGGYGSDLLIDVGSVSASSRVKVINSSFTGATLTNASGRMVHSAAVRNSNVLFINCSFAAVTHSGLHIDAGAQVEVINSLFWFAGEFGIEVRGRGTVVSLGHCSFGDSRLRKGLVLNQATVIRTLGGINAMPGPGNHVLGGRLIDLGMLHPDLPRFDINNSPRIIDSDLDGQAQVDIGVIELGLVAVSTSVSHVVSPGGSINYRIEGLLPAKPLLALSLGTSPGIALPPLGELLLDPQTLITFTPPDSGTVRIPSAAPPGLTFFTQMLTLKNGTGAFSGLSEFVTR